LLYYFFVCKSFSILKHLLDLYVLMLKR